MKIPYMVSDISVPGSKPDLDQLHFLIVLIVTECFHDVLTVIDHIQLFSSEWKKEPLKSYGNNSYTENNVIYIIPGISRTYHSYDRENGGSGTSQTGKSSERLLLPAVLLWAGPVQPR